MKVFINKGCGTCVLLEHCNGVSLVACIDKSEYAIASGLKADGTWHSGAYTKSLRYAIQLFIERSKH